MLNTIRGWFKPELTDPADIRELNKTLDLQEINMDSMNGYAFAKDILLSTDSVEIGKIHLNKIPADPDFGKQFLVTAGTLWSNATTQEENIGIKLDKGPVSTDYDTAKKIEDKIESLLIEDTELHTYRDVTYTFTKKGKMVTLVTTSSIADAAYQASNVFNVSAPFRPLASLTDTVGANAATEKRGELILTTFGDMSINFEAGRYSYRTTSYVTA